MRRLIGFGLASAIALGWCTRSHHEPPAQLRFATFNIEEFPKDSRQIEAAFDEIERLDAGFVAIQEVHDAAAMVSAARRRLGESWRFVSAEPGTAFDLGVLYDHDRFSLRATTVHDETRLGGRNKPVFEARLRPVDGGAVIRVLVVHFRCCTEGRDTRVAQHAALRDIVREAQRTRDHVVVLGDFNATTEGDRADLARLAATTGLTWASEPLACTAFWRREDGCARSRLDHVLTWQQPDDIRAAGGCASHGCEREDRCPLYVDEVSDHCPVVVTIE